jgi:hypothetical protein
VQGNKKKIVSINIQFIDSHSLEENQKKRREKKFGCECLLKISMNTPKNIIRWDKIKRKKRLTFSTATTTPSLHLIPIAVPLFSTAFCAYSTWNIRPSGLNCPQE